uniref:LysM domain-containing protein n=1 Tax=Oryza barthii TaxID=65489 RepID=A0A0D3FAY8_9ORYZ
MAGVCGSVAAAAAMVVVVMVSSLPGSVEAKTTIEPCTGSDSCSALLGYTLYADMKVSEVAALFGTDPAALLAANALDFGAPGAAHRILPMGLFVRVPTRATVADGVFAGLASADQIRNANALASADPDAPLDPGQKLVVPLPCVCFNSSDNNLPAVYLSYVVQVGDTVPAIAASYETTVTDVMNVNAMGSPIAAPGDILAIPLPACTSAFPKSASDHGLIVANGTYALTAGNCVQCSCGPGNLNLYCTPASLTGSCPSMQCSNSNVLLGNVSARSTSAGCNVSSCSYGGFVNGTITTLLSTGLQSRCPGPHQFPELTEPPTTVNHDSTFLPPLSAPGPAEAGGAIPPPNSGSPSVQGGSFTLPKVSTANGPAGSVSEAPWMNKPHQILSSFILCLLLLYSQM